ncbi:MAG: histidine kinase [Bacteroidota bacterium]
MAYINVKANARRQLELVKNAFETQEKERERIARDLHDSIGQQISAIKLHVGLLGGITDKSNLLSSIIEKQQMLSNTNEELRTITRNLMPVSISEYGVSVVLNELVNNIRKTNNIQLLISNNNEKKRYRPDFEINLFRIIQEMINNTIKYASASEVKIEVKHGDEALVITYADNGSGFESEKVKYGSGLRNIEARTKFYDGNYSINSNIAGGTSFSLRFNIKDIKPNE